MSDTPELVANTVTNSEIIFEQAFREHYKGLYSYAYTFLKDDALAEESVQNIFYKLWEKKQIVSELQSIAAYLYRAVYNECMNHLKHQKVRQNYEAHTLHTHNYADTADAAAYNELQQQITKALNELPEQCRTIFQMSRFEDMKYREIADKLGISVKTVENQMGKALKRMKLMLSDYLPILWVVLYNLHNLLQ